MASPRPGIEIGNAFQNWQIPIFQSAAWLPVQTKLGFLSPKLHFGWPGNFSWAIGIFHFSLLRLPHKLQKKRPGFTAQALFYV